MPRRTRTVHIVVETSDPERIKRADSLRRRLGASEDADSPPLLQLAFMDNRVELRDAETKPGRGVCIDFLTIDRRTGPGNLSRRQPLARAIGDKAQHVVDATAGLGHDAVLLALIGWRITTIERSPVIAELLRDGLSRALDDAAFAADLNNRLKIIEGDARQILREMHPPPDVVYIDPMFPAKRRSSALARKPLRLLREIVGDDPDASELLAVARSAATQRVVVKRSDDAPRLAEDVTATYRGKLVRYDMYRTL